MPININDQYPKKYRADSAASKMVPNVPVVDADSTLGYIKNVIFNDAEKYETINYIYIIDEKNRLVGVISLKEILQKPVEMKAKDLMFKNPIKAHPNTDQEKVANLALKNNLKAIPIVSKDGLFLGAVPSDAILNILNSEFNEDILHSIGVEKKERRIEELMETSSPALAKRRLPWLFMGLLGGVFAAQIVNFFESSLGQYLIFAAFIPLIVYMADAVGAQAQTLFIRSLALNQYMNFKIYFIKELKTSLIMATALSLTLLFASLFLFPSCIFGAILGTSLFLTIIFASAIAVFIPWALNLLKKDPALGSGPIGTIIRDILSLLIYFSIASFALALAG